MSGLTADGRYRMCFDCKRGLFDLETFKCVASGPGSCNEQVKAMSGKQWRFEIDKTAPQASWARRGKCEWRDDVTLRLSRRRALDLIRRLAIMLSNKDPGCDVYDVNLPGELIELDDKGEPK